MRKNKYYKPLSSARNKMITLVIQKRLISHSKYKFITKASFLISG